MGKAIGIGMIVLAILFGIGVYYAQVFGYYDEVDMTEVKLTSIVSGQAEPIVAQDITAIDGSSSPIRFRGCFQTSMSTAMLTETYEVLDTAEPRNAPYWFDCFDAERIGEDIKAGNATAFMGTSNLEYGIDRVVAIYPDGQGFIWHQINSCGEKLYDGTTVTEDCPARD